MNVFKKIDLPNNHPFLLNKYTYWYYAIIHLAKNEIKKMFYKESHHIIPDCFYVNNRSKGTNPGWIIGNSNDITNKVMLSAEKHFVCHWLLTKMISGNAYFKMEKALAGLRRASNGQSRVLTSWQYSRARIASSIAAKHHNKGRVWWNNGIKQKFCKSQPELEWIRGMLPNKKKNLEWWTDGINQKQCNEKPGLEWYKGRRIGQISTNGKRWWNNGIEQKLTEICPDGWVPGHVPVEPIGVKWWNNGIENKQAIICPEGFVAGYTFETNEGKSWWNDGTNQVISFECPDGFIKGKIPEKGGGTIGLKNWNNGIEHIMSATCPEGDSWIAGRLPTDKQWFNNRIISRRFISPPDNTWSLGRLPMGSWFNNGIISCRMETCPIGWAPGRIKK